MKLGRMAWIGFGIILVGWVLLIADLTISDSLLRAGNLVSVLSLRSDIVTLAQTVIISGFGFAVIGTLQAGFGAFTRFFDAVLQRSVAPRPKGPTTLEPEPLDAHPPQAEFEPEPESFATAPKVIVPDRHYEKPSPSRPATDRPVIDRGKPARNREKNYVILSDGSVEVETMFGTRIFANLEEAKDFIR